jgi:hypothetical protein
MLEMDPNAVASCAFDQDGQVVLVAVEVPPARTVADGTQANYCSPSHQAPRFTTRPSKFQVGSATSKQNAHQL